MYLPLTLEQYWHGAFSMIPIYKNEMQLLHAIGTQCNLMTPFNQPSRQKMGLLSIDDVKDSSLSTKEEALQTFARGSRIFTIISEMIVFLSCFIDFDCL